MNYWTDPHAAGWTCAECGLFVGANQSHTCVRTVHPSLYHQHVWAYGGADAMYVYLVCQCGATKKTVPE